MSRASFLIILLWISLADMSYISAQDDDIQQQTQHQYRKEIFELKNDLKKVEESLNQLKMIIERSEKINIGNKLAVIEAQIASTEEAMNVLYGQLEEYKFSYRQLDKKLNEFINSDNFQYRSLESNNYDLDYSSLANKKDVHLGIFDQNYKLSTGTEGQSAKEGEETNKDKIIDHEAIKQQYDQAFNLVRQSQFGEAEIKLKAFIHDHPEYTLSSNAYYWLGEIYYVQKKYEKASVQFLRGYRNFQDQDKAVDNLLKLAMSFAKINKKSEACKTFVRLKQQYPNADNAIKQKMQNEMDALSCQ